MGDAETRPQRRLFRAQAVRRRAVHLINNGKCWAESLGTCDGAITKEHLVSESLFGRRIRLEGGLFGSPAIETSIRNLTANILCNKHNEELGGTADAAALRPFRHLKTSHDPLKLRGSRILRPPVDRRISGTNFGRRLCKTHCNFMVVSGMNPSSAYVAGAFLVPSTQLYFYFDAALDEAIRFADGRDPVVQWVRISSDDQPDFDAFEMSLSGLRTTVSTSPLRKNGLEMIDRLRVLQWTTPLGLYRILFDWGEEANSPINQPSPASISVPANEPPPRD